MGEAKEESPARDLGVLQLLLVDGFRGLTLNGFSGRSRFDLGADPGSYAQAGCR